MDKQQRDKEILNLYIEGYTSREIAEMVLGGSSKKSTVNNIINRHGYRDGVPEDKNNLMKPKVLLIDIETAPMKGYVWSMWNNNLGLNQLHTDWFMISYSAKWLGDAEDKVMYKDLRGKVHLEDDKELLEDLWHLLDEADIVIGQNSIKFDEKKINARLVMNGYQPPSSYKSIDTLQIAKRKFGFTSNKLEYMTDKLCTKYKKYGHAKFSGFELWKECLNDNLEAWYEMEEYNSLDVLSLEELYLVIQAWDNKHPNFNVYHEENTHVCRCGSSDIIKYGYTYTGKSKFQRYRCRGCGAETRDSINLFDKEKRKSLHLNVRN